ncbi:MAG: hypothetical protein ABJD53_09095 [Gammaproteobacteria bacterium]
MATPADQRLLELLDKWLNSLELHAKYSSLDDDSYWKIQPWVEHQRPSRWIIDLGMQKTLALRNHVRERVKTNDAQYSDSLELMIFLANLVGSEHIERFIPMADANNERPLERRASRVPQQPTDATTTSVAVTATATREMPRFVTAKRPPAAAGTAQVARTERRIAVPLKPTAKAAAKQPVKGPVKTAVKPARSPTAAPADRGLSDAARTQVIADATRLVQWGRRWYELPELIARMADRPSLPEVRRILKENKAAIDAKVGVG